MIFRIFLSAFFCTILIFFPKASQPNQTSKKLSKNSDLPPNFTNSFGMELILIKSGTFKMGSTNDNLSNELPVHDVKISRSFYLGKYELTQAEWTKVMGDNPSEPPNCPDYPVVNVSWKDIQKFLRRLNNSDKKYHYDLPSEAQWEYACRAGTTGSFSDPSPEEVAFYDITSKTKVQPVGKKRPNPWGLFDMHGNVWEWCKDQYHKDYTGAPTDGSAWVDQNEPSGVLRGGSYNIPASRCHSSTREQSPLNGRNQNYGFRVVATRLPQEKVKKKPQQKKPKENEGSKDRPRF